MAIFIKMLESLSHRYVQIQIYVSIYNIFVSCVRKTCIALYEKIKQFVNKQQKNQFASTPIPHLAIST